MPKRIKKPKGPIRITIGDKLRTVEQARVYRKAQVFDRRGCKPDALVKLSVELDKSEYLTQGNTFAQEMRDFIEFVHNDGTLDPLDFGVIY
jgi:hypothetical protein